MRVLDLFSGIGGFSLGLERAGMETVAFCEIEAFPRAVLKKHWPEVPCYEDVRTLTAERLAADGITVDVICGGFPCQDVSVAGKRQGLGNTRSGLWSEFYRLICEIRPKFVIVENTPGLLSLGMGIVLGDMAEGGYDAQWESIPAGSVGLPHLRDRVWIVAYPNGDECRRDTNGRNVRSGESQSFEETKGPQREWDRRGFGNGTKAPRDSYSEQRKFSFGRSIGRMGRLQQPIQGIRDWSFTSEPVLRRGDDGIPNRLDRVGALGNAVVPQIPELIGRAIMDVSA